VKISARNKFRGEIVLIKKGAVNAEVVIRIDGGEYISAVITNKSVDELGLKEGNQAWALFKAASVILVLSEEPIKTSARNQFFGRITDCQKGVVNGEVVIQSEGSNTVTAIVTTESIERLGLNQGVSVLALVKASSILIGLEE
jgi:molybdate transport system regulatory protein